MTTALVTGASSGIGEAIARELAAHGHDVVLVARRVEKLASLAASLRAAHGVTTHVIAADLTRPGAVEQLVVDLDEHQIDVLVNNAGIGDFGVFVEADQEKLAEMVQLNVLAVTQLTRALLPGMVRRGSGRVLDVASTAAFFPGPLMAVYYATKAYVLSFGEAVAHELRGTGVTMTTLCPGPIATEFQAGADMGHSKLVAGRRLMSAEACARHAVRDLFAGKTISIPGRWNRLQVQAPRFLPRRLVPGIIHRAQAPS